MPVPATSGSFRTDLSSMNVGDYIAYKYTATSGVAGTISDFGASLATAQANEIPVTGAAAPNGYAYAIKVAPGVLITDRVVQHSISWDSLNAAKYMQGKIHDIGLVRSLSGGAAYLGIDEKSSLIDKGLGAWPVNNEWDRYVVNSTLNGKITAGDNNVWHWNLTPRTWCQDTLISGSGYRVMRGSCVGDSVFDVNRTNYYSSSGSFDNIGFRPVLEFVENISKQTNIWY